MSEGVDGVLVGAVGGFEWSGGAWFAELGPVGLKVGTTRVRARWALTVPRLIATGGAVATSSE